MYPHLFPFFISFFFFNDTATTEIYTLSLHDALPIYELLDLDGPHGLERNRLEVLVRSEEHTSELQSLRHLVCRLLLEKKKKTEHTEPHHIHRKRTKPTTPHTATP